MRWHTRTVKRWSNQALNWMSATCSVLLVYESDTHGLLLPVVSIRGIYLIATYTSAANVWSRNFKQHCQNVWDSNAKKKGTFCLCSVFRMGIIEQNQQPTYQMNENKNDGMNLFLSWNSHMFKALLNEEPSVGRWAVNGMRPRTGERQHCCFQTCGEARKEGRLPSWAGGEGERQWGRRPWWAPCSFQGPLKLVRLVTQHWLQVYCEILTFATEHLVLAPYRQSPPPPA